MEYYHPILSKIIKLHLELTRDGMESVFVWVPGHLGVRENSAADFAAEDIIDGLKPRSLALWQSRWYDDAHNKLHIIFPKLDESISFLLSNRREETSSQLHIDHSYNYVQLKEMDTFRKF